MNRIERELIALISNTDCPCFKFPDPSHTIDILEAICNLANNDQGNPGHIIIGVSRLNELIGIKGNMMKHKDTILDLFSFVDPVVNYSFRALYNPTNYANYIIIDIFPHFKRFFFPHKYHLEIEQSSLELDHKANAFFTDEEFEKYGNENLFHKIKLLADIITSFENEEQFTGVLERLGIKFNSKKIGIKIVNYFLGSLDFDDPQLISHILRSIIHIFGMLSKVKIHYSRSIYSFITDLILSDNEEFNLRINNVTDLERTIELFNRASIIIDPESLILKIEKNVQIKEIIDNFDVNNPDIAIDNKITRINEIILPYMMEKKIKVGRIFKVDLTKQKISNINRQIIELDKIDRAINNQGRHGRDTKLSVLIKLLYDYECQSCGTADYPTATITTSHMIPLYFGVEFGGLDKSYNMEVLCRFCHDRYESKFEADIEDNVSIKTRDDLYLYLKHEFQKNKYLNQKGAYSPLIIPEQEISDGHKLNLEENTQDLIKVELKKVIYALIKGSKTKIFKIELLTEDQINKVKQNLVLLSRGLNMSQDETKTWFDFGRLSYRLELFEEAINIFKTIVNCDETHYKAFLFMGYTYFEMNQLIDSMNSFTYALKLNSKLYEALYYQGKIHYKRKEHDKSLIKWKEALLIAPSGWKDYSKAREKINIIKNEIKVHTVDSKGKKLNRLRHNSSISFTCSYCKTEFKSIKKLKKHVRDVHPKENNLSIN